MFITLIILKHYHRFCETQHSLELTDWKQIIEIIKTECIEEIFVLMFLLIVFQCTLLFSLTCSKQRIGQAHVSVFAKDHVQTRIQLCLQAFDLLHYVSQLHYNLRWLRWLPNILHFYGFVEKQ